MTSRVNDKRVVLCQNESARAGSTTMSAPAFTAPRCHFGRGVTRLSEVTMARTDQPLTEQITNAHNELKLARRDGCTDWIADAAETLDELLDKVPRTVCSPWETS